MSRIDPKPVLAQLLRIKQSRETGLRHRLRRLDEEIASSERQRDGERTRQRELRQAWQRASQTEQQVGPRDFSKLKQQFAAFYRDEQQLQTGLRQLDGEIADRRETVVQTSRSLRRILRAQERLKAVMEEMR